MRAIAALPLFFLLSGSSLAGATSPPEKPKSDKSAKKTAPKVGVKTPGVQIPFESLKSLADIAVAGKPGELFFNDAAWFTDSSKDSLFKIDGKTNKLGDPIAGLHKPCSGLASGFGSLLIPNCGDGTLTRYEVKGGKTTATAAFGVAGVEGGVAASADSIWLLTDGKTTLSRIDPETNRVVSELRIPAGCDHLLFAEKALWATCAAEGKVLRIDPETNLVVNRIEVSAKPRALAAGENSIWVLCAGEGKVARIDPKTNKVTKTIDLEIPNAGGNLAFGEGSIWVAMAGFPLARIDVTEEKVMQQFTGEGAASVYFGLGSVWLAETGKIRRIDPKRVLATLAE